MSEEIAEVDETEDITEGIEFPLGYALDKEIPLRAIRFADWVKEQTGYEIDAKDIFITTFLLPKWNVSAEHQEYLAEKRAARLEGEQERQRKRQERIEAQERRLEERMEALRERRRRALERQQELAAKEANLEEHGEGEISDIDDDEIRRPKRRNRSNPTPVEPSDIAEED